MSETKYSIDPTVNQLLEKARKDGVQTIFDRAEKMKPCPIGAEGSCCKLCAMGPCRMPSVKRKPEMTDAEFAAKEAERRGLCGATATTVAARNFCRMIAAGTAAHSDHGRGVVDLFRNVVNGHVKGYEIKDKMKLFRLAMDLGIEIEDRPDNDIAKDVAEAAGKIFGQQEGEIPLIRRAPIKRQDLWRKLGIVPRGVDREVVELMHRTHMGVDMDYRNLMKQGSRTSLADGWGGSMISTELQDIMFGTPEPIVSQVNLGVFDPKQVNVVVHGHEPLLPEMIVVASRDPELIAEAKKVGATGINLSGLCCTANEILMRHGVPIAGNFLQQELALTTGVVDAMVVDVQCIIQALVDVAKCYNTTIITTDTRAKIPGATHLEFQEHNALDVAKQVIRVAIGNFPKRKKDQICVPSEKTDMVVGFSHETIAYLLGGSFRASYKPLNDNIINGRIRGIAGVVGCNNARTTHDSSHILMIKELLKNDVIVLTTGCAAMAAGKLGLLDPVEGRKFCGPGLAEVCDAVGIPPVLHMGACVDNSRILMAATAVVKEGGLGDDISDLPAVGAAPEWMSEKAIAIGQYFVASGVYTLFGVGLPIGGSQELQDLMFKEFGDTLGGKWAVEVDPIKAAHMMIEQIDIKRKALGIDKARERVLYDMEMRRELQ